MGSRVNSNTRQGGVIPYITAHQNVKETLVMSCFYLSELEQLERLCCLASAC